MQTFALEPGKYEGVDGIAWPGAVLDAGQLRAFWRDEGPVCFPLRALLHPPAQCLDLTRAELVAPFIGRGHPCSRVVRRDALDQLAVDRIARNDRQPGSCFQIKAELGSAIGGIGSVAGVALVGQYGPHIAIELDDARFGGAADRSQQQGDNGIAEAHVNVISIVVPGRRPSRETTVSAFCSHVIRMTLPLSSGKIRYGEIEGFDQPISHSRP
jgi:hypothetical protein